MRLRTPVRLAGVVALTFIPVMVCGTASATTPTVPFTDVNSTGYIGLCDLSGHNVTSGNIHDAPFAWKAISSVEAPLHYRGNGENTGLSIYQARQGVPPADWSGDDLTAASFYKTAAFPTASATYKDFSLSDFMKEYPPSWEGLYELRMAFGLKNYGVDTLRYPSTVIQVTGNTWHVVRGGLVDCGRGIAVSDETVSGGVPQLPAKTVSGETPASAEAATRAVQTDTAGGSTAATTKSGNSSNSSNGNAKVAPRPLSAPLRDVAVTSTSNSSGLGPIVALIAVGVVGIAVGLAAALLLRRRRPGGAAT